jgi:cytidine deaminase
MAGIEEVLARAREMKSRAYAPYSGFKVGAAVRTSSGAVYSGCNVENAAYPQGQCAEAGAIAQMIASGENEIIEVAVIGNGDQPCPPCGGCRQRLREFGRPDTPVHMAGDRGGYLRKTLGELLPHSFGPEWLNGEEG